MQKLLDNWFNYFTMMIYLSFTVGMIWLIIRNKLNPQTIILPVAVLGGVVYHMIFEAKSQYILPYFVLMVPFAVFGFIETINALNKTISKLSK